MKAASVMALTLVLAASVCSGEVVFEEDFESPEDYKRRNGDRSSFDKADRKPLDQPNYRRRETPP